MDVKDFKIHLKENQEGIIRILNHFKFHSIEIKNNNIMCKKPDGDGRSVSIKLDDNLTSSSFSISYSGDFFGMIAATHNMEFGDVLYTCKLIINKKITHNDELDIFDGLLDNIYKRNEVKYITYPDEILDKYEDIWNYRFTKDYIKPTIQKEFEIGYCNKDQRITIPWRDEDGKLIGVMGRANYDTELRYYPLIPFAKRYHLYGLNKSKKYIKENKVAYIGESEKFTMQLCSYGYKNSVSLGCSTISQYQVELLIKNGCKVFILCLDEGSKIETIKRNVEVIRDCLFMMDDVKIGVLLDRKNNIMPKGSKCSPSDLGKERWEELINNYVKYN